MYDQRKHIMSFMCIFATKKTYDAKNVCVIELNSTQTAFELFIFRIDRNFKQQNHLCVICFELSNQLTSQKFNSTYCTNPFNLLLRHPLLFSNHVIPVHAARIFHLSIKTGLLLFQAWNHKHPGIIIKNNIMLRLKRLLIIYDKIS